MYDSDSSDDFSLPPRPALDVDPSRIKRKLTNTSGSPKSSTSGAKTDSLGVDHEIDNDPYAFNMLDDYQQMQLAKMGDYLRWATLSCNMKRHCGFPSLSLSIADVVSCLIFGIMKFDRM